MATNNKEGHAPAAPGNLKGTHHEREIHHLHRRENLSAAAAALRFALGESDSALASLAILRSLEKTMRAFNETSSLRDALKADDASTASPTR